MSTFIQRSFTAGELGQPLYARVDQARYAAALRTCRNMIVMRHGGVTNRPGDEFIGEVKDSSKAVRLIPFIVSNTQTYVLEFGNLYMRVISNGSYILEAAKTITAITKANPGVVTSAAHGYLNGDEVVLSGIVGMTQLNGRHVKVANKAANTFEITDLQGNNINTTSYTTYSSAGSAKKVYTLTSIYLEADLPDVTFAQSADILEMTHLTTGRQRVGRLTATTFDTNLSAGTTVTVPGNFSVSGAGAAGLYSDVNYQVINRSDSTGQESVGTKATGYAKPTAGAPHTLTWTPLLSGDRTTYVYRSYLGVYGLIGLSKTMIFFDDGSVTPDFTQRPPIDSTDILQSFLFDSNLSTYTNYPAAVTYFQRRLVYAGGTGHPETVISSRIGLLYHYVLRSTQLDDDCLNFTINGEKVQQIKHLVSVGDLLLFTNTGEWSIGGNQDGIITPSSIFPKQHSAFGCNNMAPIVINSSVLFVQAQGSLVRDIAFDFKVNRYSGNDITIFSPHLFENYTLVNWAYQLNPHSVVWAARSDGTLLGLTYLKEQDISGWHRHDFTDGIVENTCVVPENGEDKLYVVVKRTINGATRRYVERFSKRNFSNIVDAIFMDSTLTYDGRNTGSTTMTLSGGTNWTYGETLTLTASTSFFASGDVGNAIHLTGSDGTLIRFTVAGFTSATVVTGHAQKTVPVVMRSAAMTTWTKAVDVIGGLWHLEGLEVSVLADGNVVASPNNPKYDVVTVSGGNVMLDKPYGVVHIGIPYISDVETLDIDTAQGETVSDKKKLITEVNMMVESSRGGWAGPKPPTDDEVDPLENLYELKQRRASDNYSPIALTTETVKIPIKSEWNSNGRVFIRQVDPLPLTILSISPTGLVPFRGG